MKMVSILDLIALGILEFGDWYAQAVLGEADFIMFIVKQFLLYMLVQIILWIFPFLQTILNKLCAPFRIVHVYLHVHTAKEISRELNDNYEKGEDDDPILDYGRLRSSLATGLDRPDENAVLVISFNRLEYAKRVALAPRNFVLILLIGYCVVTPLRFINPPGLLSVVTSALNDPMGALLHFYFFLGRIRVQNVLRQIMFPVLVLMRVVLRSRLTIIPFLYLL